MPEIGVPARFRRYVMPSAEEAMEHRDMPTGALESTPVFRDFSPATLAALAAGSRHREVSRNALVFDEGDTCRWVYVLESGSCYRANADGREQILRVFERPGDTFALRPRSVPAYTSSARGR